MCVIRFELFARFCLSFLHDESIFFFIKSNRYLFRFLVVLFCLVIGVICTIGEYEEKITQKFIYVVKKKATKKKKRSFSLERFALGTLPFGFFRFGIFDSSLVGRLSSEVQRMDRSFTFYENADQFDRFVRRRCVVDRHRFSHIRSIRFSESRHGRVTSASVREKKLTKIRFHFEFSFL